MPTDPFSASEPDSSDLRVRHAGLGRVELMSRTLFADPASPFCRRFVTRLFSVPEAQSLTIDRAGAEIEYASAPAVMPALMRRIASALRGDDDGDHPADSLHLSARDGGPVRVRRYGAVVSTWEVRHVLPGRFRLRHPGLRRHRGIADAVLEDLATIRGVTDCRVGLHTGSLLVVHDPDRIGLDDVLRVCESVLARVGADAAEAPTLTSFGIGSLLLTLAFAGYYVFPPLLVACALLLVAANVGTFRRAWRTLRAGKVDVDVAYCTLITLAVFAGDFRSIAVTAWCVRSWPLLVDRRLAATRRALGVGGRRVEGARPGHDTVAGVLRRRVLDATRVTSDDRTPGHELANRAASPVLAAATIGGLTGGLGTSIAVLAPNYYAAPALHPLHRSSALLRCARAGFLVRDEAALSRFAAARAVLVDVEVGTAEREVLLSGFRVRGIERVLFLSKPGASSAAGAARRLRTSRSLQRDGLTAFIGIGADTRSTRKPDVTIAFGGSSLPAADAADIVLLAGRLERVLELLDLARAHARETRLDRRLGLWPNVVAVGGALLIGTPSLVSAALTNLGALAVYWRGSRRLTEAEAAWRHRPDRLPPAF